MVVLLKSRGEVSCARETGYVGDIPLDVVRVSENGREKKDIVIKRVTACTRKDLCLFLGEALARDR
jgi:hypothetical protein